MNKNVKELSNYLEEVGESVLIMPYIYPDNEKIKLEFSDASHDPNKDIFLYKDGTWSIGEKK